MGSYWSDEEIDLLKSFRGKKTLSEASDILHRSKQSIKRKAEREGIKLKSEVNVWSKREEELLIEYVNLGVSYKDIARKLYRSIESVKHKAYTLDIQEHVKEDARTSWSIEEEEYLEKYYDKYPIEHIAKKFGRTVASVKDKAYSMCLVHYNETISFKELSRCFETDISVIKRWKRKFNMPCREMKCGTAIHYLVKPDEFWKWAEGNKDIIPWERYTDLSILPQPDYVRELTREARRVKKNHRAPIPKHMVQSIGRAYYEKSVSIKDLCDEYGRTKDSIKHILRKYNKLLDFK